MRQRILAASVTCLLVFAASCKPEAQQSATKLDPNRYYAVLLNNGSVYFGKLEGLGTPYLTLRDVFYVQSSVNPDTKATTNVLVRRGKELHGPDLMIISEKSVTFIEPVGVGSKVGQLIEESKKQSP
jgi:hypothetical protein